MGFFRACLVFFPGAFALISDGFLGFLVFLGFLGFLRFLRVLWTIEIIGIMYENTRQYEIVYIHMYPYMNINIYIYNVR